MKLLGFSIAVIALLAVASVAHGELAIHVPGDSIEDAIESIHADPVRDWIFTVHWEGRVEARDEVDGALQWAWRFTQEPAFETGAIGQQWAGTTAHGFDMVADDDAVYVSLIQEQDGLSQPVVALDKDTGKLLWFLDPGMLADAAGYVAPSPSGPAIDAYGLAIDPTDTEPWLYVGTAAGYIFKVDRGDGQPALEGGTLNPLAYKPEFEDVSKVPRPTKTKDTEPYGCSRESRIHTIGAYGGTFFAARNWGGADKQFNCHHMLATSTNNTIIWGTTNDLQAIELLLPLTDQIEDTPVARPGIREINVAHDEANDGLDVVLGGEASGSSGYLTVLHDFPYGPAPFWADGYEYSGVQIPEVFTYKDDDLVEPDFDDANLTELGPGTGITGVAMDDNYVYAVTRENDTSAFPNVGPSTAWMIKLDRNTLQPATGDQNWSSIDVQGRERPARSIEPGATASDIALDPDGPAWVGHSPGASQWPDVGGFYQARGSLLLEVPRDDQAIVVWRMSNGGEFSNGFLPFAYITDYPSSDEPDLEARIEYREERPGQAVGAWKSLGEIRQNAVPANSYQQLNNVQLPGPAEMPDSVYRFRIHAEDDAGRIYTDQSDGVLTLDRMAPELKVEAPYDDDHPQHLVTVRTNQPRFEVTLSDAFTGIDPLATGVWIDDMTKGYPFLQYTWSDGRVTGFVMDLADADPGAGVPVVLAEGQHTVRVEAWDRAGNFAFEQWVINVDTSIRAPKFSPSAGGWQATARPQMTAQFYEPGIEIIEAKIDGVDVTSKVTSFPQHPQQNPEGTKLRVTPPSNLADDQPHALSIIVRDAAGNVGGPFTHFVKIDTQAPIVSGLTPEPGSLLGEARPQVGFSMADVGAGLRFDSLVVTVDGFSMAEKIPSSSDTVLFRPDAPLTDGFHTVKVIVKDLAGNVKTEEWSFRVDRTAPLVEVNLKLPGDQTAVKEGDKLIVRAFVSDASELQSVMVDARGLRPTGSGEIEMLKVPGQPGDYEAVIDVTQTRTKAIELKVQATDAGGLVTAVGYTILVDNDAPDVFLEDLAGTSVGTFTLDWTNTPGDAAIGGSGVAYYRIEQQSEGQPWQVVADHVTDTSWTGRYAENEGTTLRFRVTAVDHAGNEGDPSNAIETFAKGDPFAELLVSEVLRHGQLARFTATPVDGATLDNTTARIILESSNQTFIREMDLKGRIFVGEWNLAEVPAGPYRLYFEFDDGQGLLARASAKDVTVMAAAEPVQEISSAKDTPGLGVALLLAVLAIAGVIRRAPRS